MIQCSGKIPFQLSFLEISTPPSGGVVISQKPLSRVLPDMKHPDRKKLFSLCQISQKISEKKRQGLSFQFNTAPAGILFFELLNCSRR